MFNFHKRKNQRIVTGIIIFVLILAMLLPTLAYIVG